MRSPVALVFFLHHHKVNCILYYSKEHQLFLRTSTPIKIPVLRVSLLPSKILWSVGCKPFLYLPLGRIHILVNILGYPVQILIGIIWIHLFTQPPLCQFPGFHISCQAPPKCMLPSSLLHVFAFAVLFLSFVLPPHYPLLLVDNTCIMVVYNTSI